MSKRSKRPKWIKGEGPPPIGKGSDRPMTFHNGRSKRPDTGKKLNKSHHTPNLK
ncbi:hypothetical protein LCGC14_0729810 [marine sediment metagenome]|uniref:Uncharacterized protein n=1 Tax=marine sediment metagenome TaxID=412755 RepID=A0A0F9Q9Z9_9ZZZZ